MRVAIVSETWPPEVNGVALTVAGLALGLAQGGHTVQVVRPRQSVDPPDGPGPALDGIDTVLVRGMRLPRYQGLQFGLPAARRLRSLWRAQRPDAIYVATEGPLGGSALRAARRLGIPAASGLHTRFDEFVRHYGLGALAPIAFAWLRRFHRRAAATFVPTAQLERFLAQHGFGNVVRLPRAVDARLFDPSRRDDALRAEWGVGPKQIAVVHVGRIAAEKNLPLVVRSFRAIQAIAPGARCVWVGDGPARAALAAQNPDFVFCGVQRGVELARHFASADLFVFPSLTETFGNVTLEALASGVPTVAFDYAAAHEYLDGACGRRVPFGDARAFVTAAVDLATDIAALKRAGVAARAAVAGLDPSSVTAEFARALAALGRAAGEPDAAAHASSPGPVAAADETPAVRNAT